MGDLIFLHGALGSAAQMEKLSAKFADTHMCHSFNFYGHGGEPANAKHFRIESFAGQLEDFMQSAGIKNADVFGYSMGGYVALYLAARKPELFNRIITLGTKMKWTEEIAARETAMLNPEKIEQKLAAFADFLSKRHHPEDWKKVMRATAEMMLDMGKKPPLSLTDLKKVEVAVHIMLGDKDKMVSEEESREAASSIAGAEFKLLKNTPHPLEQVDVDLLYKELKTLI